MFVPLLQLFGPLQSVPYQIPYQFSNTVSILGGIRITPGSALLANSDGPGVVQTRISQRLPWNDPPPGAWAIVDKLNAVVVALRQK